MLTTVKKLKIINNPSRQDLRRYGEAEEISTACGAPAYKTKKAASRSGQVTFIGTQYPLGLGQQALDPQRARQIEALMPSLLEGLELLQIDRQLGANEKKTWHCRLLIPKEYARLALLWSETLFEPTVKQKDPLIEPDFLTIDLPGWPESFGEAAQNAAIGPRGIFVFPDSGKTYVLGSDYVGEVKMSFLRQAMAQMKKKKGLGLHAGSKIIKIQKNDGLQEMGVLLFGLSGTGKTTLTLDHHGLQSPEGIELLQDDIVWLTPQGEALGTENNFYVKTEGISEKDQPAIYQALKNPQTVFENVYINETTRHPEYGNSSWGTNGRALAIRSQIQGSSPRINLNKVHKMFFITRRDTIVPPVAKLNPQQAMTFFMLGESIETSAGDPTRAGQPKHEVGFNPFIIGPEHEEGQRLMEIIQANKIECYLLNTGSLGVGGDQSSNGRNGIKITKDVSAAIIQAVCRNTIIWRQDLDWGYEIATAVKNIENWDPLYIAQTYYTQESYDKLTEQLKQERRQFLEKYNLKLLP